MSSTSAEPKPVLDHIVLLVPPAVLQSLPSWLADEFTILTGGRHADGLTENKLIVLPDGVYLELIAFVDGTGPERRASHRWGGRPEGRIVDWAFTLLDHGSRSGEEQFQAVQDRVAHAASESDTGVVYNDPVPGGRVTPAGTELRWAVAAPRPDKDGGKGGVAALDNGEAPFWCLDRTPRNLRVPSDEAANVQHPCGAVGFAGVTISVRDKRSLEALRHVYDAIYGVAASTWNAGYRWPLHVPADKPGSGFLEVRLLPGGGGGGAAGMGDETSIRLAMISAPGAGTTIGGVLHDGWKIEIDLVAP